MTNIELSASAMRSPSKSLLPPLPQPQDAAPPRAVYRLAMGSRQAADFPPPRSPSPGRAASPVVEEAPASPIVHCSQSRVEEYERQNGPLPGPQKIGGWLCDVQAACGSPARHGPTGSRLTRLRPPPRTIINTSRTRTRSTTVRADAAAIAATYAHQEGRPACAQGLRGPPPTVLLCHGTPRGLTTLLLPVLYQPRHRVGTQR